MTAGTSHSQAHDQHISLGSDKIGLLSRNRVPQVVNNIDDHPVFTDGEWLKSERIASCVAFPLFVESRLIGLIGLFSRGQLPDDTIELLDVVVGHLRRDLRVSVLDPD